MDIRPPKTSTVMASNKYHREYQRRARRTPAGRLRATYSDMLKRVKGKTNRPNYKGMDICSREEFLEMFINDTVFLEMLSSGRRFSIDRIDINKGYVKGNMQWLYSNDHLSKDKSIPVEGVDPETNEIVVEYDRMVDANNDGYIHTHISKCCRNLYGFKTHKGLVWRYSEAKSEHCDQ